MKIHFIITGGTIDSYYEGTKDTVMPLKHSVIPQFIESLKLSNKMQFTEVCMKDSRNITKNDLKKLSTPSKKVRAKKSSSRTEPIP